MRPNSLVLIFNKDNKKLLIQKGEDKETGLVFCRLIGGGIDFGETSLIAIRREIKEELGFSLKNDILLEVIENIFEYNGKKGHEITFLYKGEIVEKEFYQKRKIPILDKEDGDYAEWVAVSDIKKGKIKLFPEEAVNFI